MLRYGNVVKSIVDAAIEFDVDLIGMPTAGHHSVLDALRGSTTERVIRHTPCPVFAVPAGYDAPNPKFAHTVQANPFRELRVQKGHSKS